MTTRSGISVRYLKKGRVKRAAIYTMPDGREALVVYRKMEELYRAGERTASDAIRKGSACWGVEEEYLILARAKKIKFTGVEVKETGDQYLTLTEAFSTRSRLLPFNGRRQAMQRIVPLSEFRVRHGRVKL